VFSSTPQQLPAYMISAPGINSSSKESTGGFRLWRANQRQLVRYWRRAPLRGGNYEL